MKPSGPHQAPRGPPISQRSMRGPPSLRFTFRSLPSPRQSPPSFHRVREKVTGLLLCEEPGWKSFDSSVAGGAGLDLRLRRPRRKRCSMRSAIARGLEHREGRGFPRCRPRTARRRPAIELSAVRCEEQRPREETQPRAGSRESWVTSFWQRSLLGRDARTVAINR